MVPQTNEPEVLAYRVEDAARAAGLSRTTIYEEIGAGRLRSVKRAGRRLILKSDLLAYLAGEAGQMAA